MQQTRRGVMMWRSRQICSGGETANRGLSRDGEANGEQTTDIPDEKGRVRRTQKEIRSDEEGS